MVSLNLRNRYLNMVTFKISVLLIVKKLNVVMYGMPP